MSFPSLRGKYSIAVADLERKSDTPHGTQMRLWYPSSLEGNETPGSKPKQRPLWLPHPSYATGYGTFMKWPTLVGASIRFLLGSTVLPAEIDLPLIKADNVVADAKLSVPEKFPLMVFSHGLGGNRTAYSYYCASIAAQGFIVASVEHRDGTASTAMLESGPLYYQKVDNSSLASEMAERNRQLHHRIEEVKEALNVIEHLNEGSDLECVQKEGIKFTQSASMIGRIDMSRCVMAGHSFGGITALQTAAADRRFTACVVQDAWMIPCDEGFEAEYPSIPRLFINTSKFQWDANFKKQTAVMKGKDEEYGRDNARMVAICKSLHQNQSDLPLLYPALMRYMSMGGEIDAVKAAEMCVDATLVFLHKYFNNDAIEETKAAVESVLEGGPPTEVYPELVHGKTNE